MPTVLSMLIVLIFSGGEFRELKYIPFTKPDCAGQADELAETVRRDVPGVDVRTFCVPVEPTKLNGGSMRG